MVEWFFDEKFVEVQTFLGLKFFIIKKKIFFYCYSVKI